MSAGYWRWAERGMALLLWLVCLVFVPLLMVMQGMQAALGDPERSRRMALAIDMCGNALLGGDPRETISARTGRNLLAGQRWATVVAPVIDFFFGQDHCLNSAGR